MRLWLYRVWPHSAYHQHPRAFRVYVRILYFPNHVWGIERLTDIVPSTGSPLKAVTFRILVGGSRGLGI